MMVKVKVVTGSGKQEIIPLGMGEIKVFLKSVPEHNKANVELLKVLTRAYKKRVILVKGLSSKNKLVEVMDE